MLIQARERAHDWRAYAVYTCVILCACMQVQHARIHSAHVTHLGAPRFDYIRLQEMCAVQERQTELYAPVSAFDRLI